MRTNSAVRVILIATALVLSIQLCTGAVIHGAVYNWENLKPLPKAVIIVNTTPEQKYVTPDGRYSFNLPPGHYVIKAYYYKSGKVVLYAEDNITISKNGSYILDLILFPPLNVNVTQPNVEFPSMNENTQVNYFYVYLVILFVLLGITLYFFKVKKKRSEEKGVADISVQTQSTYFEEVGSFEKPEISFEIQHTENNVSENNSENSLEKEIQLLPEDLKEALEEIAKAGGRITQKELRKRLKYSEAKVSLLLTDLERRGYIEKVKKGRGNIIFLKDEFRKVFGL